MCGIYGFDLTPNANISKARKAALVTALAYSNADRGTQSWGAFLPEREQLIKQTGSILDPRTGLNVGDFVTARVGIVHTRFATRGALTAANAHPFDLGGGWVGQHNGVVGNYSELDRRYGEEPVDSIHLLKALAGQSPIPLHEISVYGSVQLVPPTRDRVYLGRMNGGELSIVEIPRVGLVFTSDEDHMLAALRLAGLSDKALHHKVEPGVMYVAINGQLFVHDKQGLAVGGYSRMTYGTWQSGGTATTAVKPSTPTTSPVARTTGVYGTYDPMADDTDVDWWEGSLRGGGITAASVEEEDVEEWPDAVMDAWELYAEIADLKLRDMDREECEIVIETIQKHIQALAKLSDKADVGLYNDIEEVREMLTDSRREVSERLEQLDWQDALANMQAGVRVMSRR